MEDLCVESKDFSLCYECAAFKHVDRMQKYTCQLCGGRKCIDLHTVDKNINCEFCGMDKLCNDCCNFGKCCQIYKEEKFYLKKDKAYLKIKA